MNDQLVISTQFPAFGEYSYRYVDTDRVLVLDE